MAQKQRGEYLTMRHEFEPATVTLVIVAESPPASGKYFYDPGGKVNEPLFRALMKQLGIQPETKIAGLRELQMRGWVLVDATYEPVNALDNNGKDIVIARDYQELCGDLKRLLAARCNEVPLVLIKANVCKLEPKLAKDGFNVLNKGRPVRFPAHGHQAFFDSQFRDIVNDLAVPPLHDPPPRVGVPQEQSWVSAAIRLMKMVGELHRMGFQYLRICPYEYPLAWRLCIAPRSRFSTKNGAFLEHAWGEYPLYSSSEGQECFGWPEADGCSPESLAQLFTERFRDVCDAGRGRDWEYAGWLTELIGHVCQTRLLPFVQAEYFEPSPEDLNFLPLKSYDADGRIGEFPLPPSIAPSFQGLVQERDYLRQSLATLQRKLAAAKLAIG